MNGRKILINIIKAVVAVLFAIGLLFITLFLLVLLAFSTVHADFYLCIVMILAVLLEILLVGILWGFIKNKPFYIPLCAAFGTCITVWGTFFGYQSYVDNIQTVAEGDDLLESYTPYAENSKAVSIDEQSDLVITEDFPIMDGATALYPIYSSFAKAVYPREVLDDSDTQSSDGAKSNKTDYLKCTTTTRAYINIVTGEADIIFAALPSDEQEQFARENGVELIYTPIGKEAFVFFVNAKNTIDNITVEQIQKIYSGGITEWSELGVQDLGKIRAFQRDEGSGSQSTLEKLMAGKQLVDAPTKDVVGGMGGIIKKTADYKNYKNAIGYSFRFYAEEMVNNNQIKLLSVNGVYPNLENIENGTYPIASYFYAVTRKDADENTIKLLEWIKGEQGQKIIELTGYTPLNG